MRGESVGDDGRPHVFISYSRSDSPYVTRLIRFLESEGISAFHDIQMERGVDWRDVIRAKIATCRAITVVMSPRAEQSRWVKIEIALGGIYKRRFMPLRLEGHGIMDLLPMNFEDVQGGKMPSRAFVKQLRALVEAPEAALSQDDHGRYVLDRRVLPWTDHRLLRLRDILIAACPTVSEIKVQVRHLIGPPLDGVNWRLSNGQIAGVWKRALDRAAEQGLVRHLLATVGSDPNSVTYHAAISEAVLKLDQSVEPTASPTTASLGGRAGDTSPLRDYRAAIDQFLRRAQGLPVGRELVSLLWRAADDIGPLPRTALADVNGVIDYLDECGRGFRKVPPVLAFLEYLIVHLGAQAERLGGILNAVAHANRVGRAEHRRVRERAVAAQAAPEPAVAIFIQIWSVAGRLSPSVWLYQSSRLHSYKLDAPEPVTARQIRREVENSIKEFEPLLDGMELANLRFEFVLPWNLLHEAVDQWAFSDGRELGTRSEVVIRSLDRMTHPLLENAWRQRSGLIDDSTAVSLDDLVEHVDDGRPIHASIVGDDRVVCGALRDPYVPPPSWLNPHHLLDAIKEGLPIALWCRHPGGHDHLVSILDEVRADGGLRSLPRAVLNRRQRALTESGPDGSHTGRHLVLLWDDYFNRPDAYHALRTPARHGGKR